MKKKFLAIAVVFAMIFVLAACGGGSGGSEEAAPAEKTAVNVFAAASLSAVMADFEASYETAHPDIDIFSHRSRKALLAMYSSAQHRSRWTSLKAREW